MLTKIVHNKRAMKAIRLGLIGASWALVVLGLVLARNA